MGWRVTDPMLEKLKFGLAVQERDVSMEQLTASFGVSRATGYRLLSRLKSEGLEAVVERSRRPHTSPTRTRPEIEEALVQARLAWGWGAKKLVHVLRREAPQKPWPSVVTAHRILVRHGLIAVQTRRRRHRYPLAGGPFPEPERINEVWTADFKGHFRLGDRSLCYPLTVADLYSRFALECRALRSTAEEPSRARFERLFREYGVPERLRTDNGVPFGSTALCGLSRLSAWWLKLGIELERIEPGCPEQNGAHERYHRTLKREATRPPERSQRAQQARFDRFRRLYNELRPHEGIGMSTPAELYRPSERRLPRAGEYPGLDYPAHYQRRQVRPRGYIKWRGAEVYLSEILAKEPVGLCEVGTDAWAVYFGPLLLGVLDSDRRFTPVPRRKKRRGPSQMS